MLPNGFMKISHLVPGLALITGEFPTDASGDFDSSAGSLPKGVASITRATAAYSIVFNDKILDVYYANLVEDDGTPEAMASYTLATRTLLFNLSAAKTSTNLRLFALCKTSDVG